MGAPPCPGCQQRDEIIAELRLRLTALEARVRDLEDQLGRNATNSSLPPSANPPGAPKLPPKTPTGRKTGAQPGHPAHLRRRLPLNASSISSRGFGRRQVRSPKRGPCVRGRRGTSKV